MSLRARLSVAFVLVALVPLLTAAVLISVLVHRDLTARVDARLLTARNAATAQLTADCSQVSKIAEQAAQALALGGSPREVVSALTFGGSASLAVVSDVTRGHLVIEAAARSAGEPADLVSLAAHATPQCATGSAVANLVAATVPLRRAGHSAGSVVVADVLSGGFLARVAAAATLPVTIADTHGLVATTLPTARQARAVAAAVLRRHGLGTVQAGNLEAMAVSLAARADGWLIVTAPAGSVGALEEIIAVVILLAAAASGLVGYEMAKVTARPLGDLADAALRVAGGDLSTRIRVASQDEIGRLGIAFNAMTDELRAFIGALEGSRDELRRNLTRLGDTLSSTHDLGRILEVILETAMASVRAEGGALFLYTPGRQELELHVGRGLEGRVRPGLAAGGSAGTGQSAPAGAPPAAEDAPIVAGGAPSPVRVRVGEGVTGRVAVTADPVRGLVGTGPERVRLAADEPSCESLISVPLRSSGRVIGVLNLYDRVDAESFDEQDLSTIQSFAAQATVAIDNVLLHQEAQRLSITDGLTGLWNYRYLRLALNREVERATRFQRSLSVLLLDLDRFKVVNDRYGHQRGDAVLIEVAARVRAVIREVDVFARYGGEEFLLILPETDVTGAELLAARIGRAVRERPFGGPDEVPIQMTTSVGIAVFPHQGRTPQALVRNADRALYVAKAAGRDCWRVADPDPVPVDPASGTGLDPARPAPPGPAAPDGPGTGGPGSARPGQGAVVSSGL